MSPLQKYCLIIALERLVIIPQLNLYFNVAFYIGNEFCVENMHILANKRPKMCINGRYIFSSKFITVLGVTTGGRGSRRMITKHDIGGRGSIF